MVMRPVLYVAILIASMIVTYGYKLRTQGIFACPATGYTADGYLGYCEATAYGDYDHGALWFGMEPQAARRAANAQVLFLGNSRMEFGFSSDATTAWFAAAGISHYLLGFSHLENETFIAPLLVKLNPRAKVYVINVDRFFDDEESAPGGAILHGSDLKRRYTEKRLWQRVQRPLCTHVPSICGHNLAFYRNRPDGHWLHRGGGPYDPLSIADAPPTEQDQWDHYAALAKQFVSKLPVDHQCVILTVVPSPATKRQEAKAIAAALGLTLLAPELDGLHSFDNTHLNESRAPRGSAAFMELAGPRIEQCLARNSTSAPPA
ncbi:MAG TPA: hypothetical protein VIY90_23870 [Steroidobacteraceae bacterium]